MPGHPAEEPGSQPRFSRCLSAAGIRFLGILFPPAGFRPPHGRPTRQCLDPGGVSTLRTSESRPDWVPSLPRGPAVLTRPVRSLRPPLAPSSRGQALSPRRAFHLPELSITRRHRGFTRVHPPGLPPSPVDPGWDRAPWACSPGFAPRQAGPARRTPGQGTGIKHSPGVIRPASAPDLLPLTHSQCATSCRTTGLDMTRFQTADTWSPGPGSPPSPASPGPARAGKKGQGNAYCAATAPRPPTAPPAPTPSSANGSAACPGASTANRARCAVARSILVIVWHLLATPTTGSPTSAPAGTPGTPTAAARPATPSASSKPSATTSSSPSGRTPPDPGASDNRIAAAAAPGSARHGAISSARNRGHANGLRWLFLGQLLFSGL